MAGRVPETRQSVVMVVTSIKGRDVGHHASIRVAHGCNTEVNLCRTSAPAAHVNQFTEMLCEGGM